MYDVTMSILDWAITLCAKSAILDFTFGTAMCRMLSLVYVPNFVPIFV